MLSEKLYTLRKKSGLSQEQLAEQLGVSRQAISKWESGQSMPESEKLIAISDYFGISLDHLLKEVDTQTGDENSCLLHQAERPRWLIGLIICVAGAVSLIVWGLLSIFAPDASDRLGGSSVIHIDGNGIFLTVCVAAIAVGAVLLLKNTKKN